MMQVQVNFKSSAMNNHEGFLLIGELAKRSGVAASALRFYEAEGLIAGSRTGGGHRQYPRHVLRRVAFIRAAQAVGLSLPDIKAALATLPEGRTPNKADWTRLSMAWAPVLDARIAALQRLRGQLSDCIGCGCLSLKACGLYNAQDVQGAQGAGSKLLRTEAPTAG